MNWGRHTGQHQQPHTSPGGWIASIPGEVLSFSAGKSPVTELKEAENQHPAENKPPQRDRNWLSPSGRHTFSCQGRMIQLVGGMSLSLCGVFTAREARSHTWSPDQTETKIPFSFSECVSTMMFSISKLNKGWEGFLLYCRDNANKKMWQRNIWEALVSLHTFNMSSRNTDWICRTNAASSVRGMDLFSTVSGILAELGEERTGQAGVSTRAKCMSASKE